MNFILNQVNRKYTEESNGSSDEGVTNLNLFLKFNWDKLNVLMVKERYARCSKTLRFQI